jgi:HTH-type transcriptional regulator / antitoxin HigA
MSITPKQVRAHWATIEPILSIRNQREYDRAIKRMNELLDEIGDDESHPLYGLLDTLGTVVHAYEELHNRLPVPDGKQMLRHLMDEHGLNQADLAEIGSQGVVSELLSGKRDLNTRQISALAQRFGVSPAVFL